MGFFKIMQFLSMGLQTVLSIERQFGRGTGAQKHIKAVAEMANNYRGLELGCGEQSLDQGKLVDAINALIVAIVKILNLFGMFETTGG